MKFGKTTITNAKLLGRRSQQKETVKLLITWVCRLHISILTLCTLFFILPMYLSKIGFFVFNNENIYHIYILTIYEYTYKYMFDVFKIFLIALIALSLVNKILQQFTRINFNFFDTNLPKKYPKNFMQEISFWISVLQRLNAEILTAMLPIIIFITLIFIG